MPISFVFAVAAALMAVSILLCLLLLIHPYLREANTQILNTVIDCNAHFYGVRLAIAT